MRNVLKRRLPLVFAAALILPWLTAGIVHAAPQAITITPTSASPTIAAGTAYKDSLQIINEGQTGYDFTVYGAPYHVNGEAYTPEFIALPNAPKVNTWFNFSQTTGFIKPGHTLTIAYTITVPSGTLPGGYYAAAFAQTVYPKSSGSIALSERVGELFYIEVPGAVVRKGSLLSWQSGFLQQQPLTAAVRLQNEGSIHYPTAINMTVKDVLGHTKYNLTVTKNLLPQTIRKVSFDWQQAPAVGLFRVGGSVNFLGQNHTLPSRWVLVLSPAARIVLGIVAGILVLMAIGQRANRHRIQRRHRAPRG